ncbi:MAG: hypothetical protein L3K02_08030 [Thermoplasmata archaeon]|jgi:hypothetical protein|nr:hypothetical protein [Thermoplasmata archaeon]
MWKKLILASIGVAVLLLIPGGPFGTVQFVTSPGGGTGAPSAPSLGSVMTSFVPYSVGSNESSGPILPTTASASINIANFSTARHLPSSFWGVNVAAAQSFTTKNAAQVAATPVTYIRFPGGVLGEEFNYTSGVLTSNSVGKTSTASTTIQDFITSCRSIHCKAILQLPAEIDQPQTAAYYVQYVVNTLHFRPAFWEVGNAVPSWSHFDTPWSAWTRNSPTQVTALSFAQEVEHYVIAIRAVDPGARIVALGMGLGHPNNDRDYITDVATYDGKNISGISVHSYVTGSAPAHPTGAELLANLNGQFSLTTGVETARGYISAACPKCGLQLFVTEANAAEVDNYTRVITTFPGTVFVAADAAQALDLRLKNLDWFAYSSNYEGAWLQGKTLNPQYTLMSQMMTHLGLETVTNTLTAPSTLYAAATYGPSGLALLLVNANMTRAVSLNLLHSGILSGALVGVEQWLNGSSGPTNSSFALSTSYRIPALSITILTVGPLGLGPASQTVSAPPAQESGPGVASGADCTGGAPFQSLLGVLPTVPPATPLLARGRD